MSATIHWVRGAATVGCGLPQNAVSCTVDTMAVTCDGCHRAIQARELAPSFTHEELLAIWHHLPAEDPDSPYTLAPTLRRAIEKLTAYESACRRIAGGR